MFIDMSATPPAELHRSGMWDQTRSMSLLRSWTRRLERIATIHMALLPELGLRVLRKDAGKLHQVRRAA